MQKKRQFIMKKRWGSKNMYKKTKRGRDVSRPLFYDFIFINGLFRHNDKIILLPFS